MNAFHLIHKAGDFVEDPAIRINRLLDDQTARIGQIFRTAIASLKGEIDLKELADLLEQGRVNDALARLKYAADALASASNVAFITSGQSTADFLSGAGVGRVIFDQVNLFAVSAMQQNTLSLVREFTGEQLKATSRAIIVGVESGTNPLAQARNFRDSIGLTGKQWGHVANYRSALERVGIDDQAAQNALARALRDKRSDSVIMRASKLGRKLKPEQIDNMVERYTDRYIKHRSKVIARTESLRAVHQGNEEAYRQAIAKGIFDEGDLERTWRTRLDGRERDTHYLLNGEARAWGETWDTVNGSLRYPGDPQAPAVETIQCRCAILTRIKRN